MFRIVNLPAAAMLLMCLAACGTSQPPNVIVIFADDLGYGDLGAFGHPTISTPHIDAMAAEGLKFTQFYTGAAVCTPSRAALLTGRLPVRSGMANDAIRVIFPPSKGGLPQAEVTMAEALQARGYATAIIGKWHLGHLPEHLPTRHGFDYYFGIPYSNDMFPAPGYRGRRSEYPPLPLMRGEEIIKSDPDQRLLTRQYTEEVLHFVRENRDRPFFIYLPHTFPHVPIFASDMFEGKSARGLYGDVIEELDWSTGQVLQELRDLNLDRNTLVVFTSDNGPWLTEGLEGGSAGLLHDGKGTTWEGGMRVPMVAWWPDVIEAGRTTDALATTMDLYATALSLAGAEVPSDRVVDGVDLLPIFRNPEADVRETVFFYRGERLFAVRKGAWKLHFVTQSAYVGDSPVVHDPPALYHLDHDPSERFNVAAQNPEVTQDILDTVAQHEAALVRAPTQLDIPEWR